MTSRWIPPKAEAARVRRARKAQALRAVRRGKAQIEQEAARRADEGIETLKRTLDQQAKRAVRRMTVYVALLRAANVGGTGKLPMAELRAMCAAAGFGNVRTYIASGNVVFESGASEARVKSLLEACLKSYAGKPVGVVVRTARELAGVLNANPFPDAATDRTVAIFLDEAPPKDALEHAAGRRNEEVRLGAREIFVHYGEGMGQSKLRIPAAKSGTARNMNTIAALAKLAAMA